MQKIVVHPGNAHRDDFLSVSVLLAFLDEAEVFRREPTREDLADLNTFVVDIGMQYDPERHNFDHHQDPSLPCAFHLVMQHLGHHRDALSVFGWYPLMSMMDVSGPHKTAEHLGVDANVLIASSSPIDGYILSRFSRMDNLQPGDLLYAFMREMGRDLIALISQKMERLELLKEQVRVLPVGSFKAIVSSLSDNPKLSMELFVRDLDDPQVVLCVTPSVRGEGWELLRLGNSDRVDFRAVAGHPQIRFVHANGYVATTHALLPVAQVLALAERCIR